MKEETKIIIGEILLWVEKFYVEEVLSYLDISDEAYQEAKQDFNQMSIEYKKGE